MFPHKQIPDVEETPPKKKDSPDFLDAHGGKLILAVISTIGFFIYRWVKGGNNKLKVEDCIAHQSPLHPYESYQFRESNSLSAEEFLQIFNSSRQQYSNGLLSYEEFINFFKVSHPHQLSMAYYLDRVILSYLETIQQNSSSKIPLSIFLVALSNALQLPPQDRSELLFDVSQTITSSEMEFFKMTNSSSPLDQDPTLYCTLSRIKSLVSVLDICWQIPYEKRVIESGVKWPFPEYRRKTPEELVDDGIKKMKPPPHKDQYMSRDEFSELILGTAVCAWGECYRKK